MNSTEQRAKAREQQRLIESQKETSDEKMAHYDSMSPEQRRHASGW